MPIGHRVRAALEAQEERLCANCGIPIPGKRVNYCSVNCRDALWRADPTKGYNKNKRDQRERKRQKIKREAAIIDEGIAALEAARKKKLDGLTTAIATKAPLPRGMSTVSAADIAPPTQAEIRAYIQTKFGSDAQRLIDRLEMIAFHLKGVQPKVIIDAVKELLDRGWGKTTQSIAVAAVAPIFAVPTESTSDALLPDLGNDDPDQPDVIEAEASPVNEGDTD
jgi:hypothetical protein